MPNLASLKPVARYRHFRQSDEYVLGKVWDLDREVYRESRWIVQTGDINRLRRVVRADMRKMNRLAMPDHAWEHVRTLWLAWASWLVARSEVYEGDIDDYVELRENYRDELLRLCYERNLPIDLVGLPSETAGAPPGT